MICKRYPNGNMVVGFTHFELRHLLANPDHMVSMPADSPFGVQVGFLCAENEEKIIERVEKIEREVRADFKAKAFAAVKPSGEVH